MSEPPGLLGPGAIRELAAQLRLRPTKQRGQNFVVDPNTIRRLVATADVSDRDVVLEVGPGLGSLTLGLLGAAARVTAVEVDEALAAALPGTVSRFAPDHADRLEVVTADALRITELPGPPPTRLVANLPYNVAVPVLLHLLERFDSIEHGLVMVQLEVAERLAAAPGSRTYGVPSVKLAWYASVERAGVVGSRVFWPRPRIDSGLVAFHRRPKPATSLPAERVFAVIDAAFAQRRKTLRAALSGLAGSAAAAEAILWSAGVDPGARGEQLDCAAFVAIAEALAARHREHGNLTS